MIRPDDRRDSMSGEEAFKAFVLPWVRKTRDPDAEEVVSVHTYGSDWGGSTESGFYSEFSTSIVWRTGGSQTSVSLDGEDLERLWEWVVANFPAP